MRLPSPVLVLVAIEPVLSTALRLAESGAKYSSYVRASTISASLSLSMPGFEILTIACGAAADSRKISPSASILSAVMLIIPGVFSRIRAKSDSRAS